MDICLPGMELPMGALPPATLPGFHFPPQQQHADVQEYTSLCRTDAAATGKRPFAAAPSGKAPAASATLAPTAKHTSLLYGSVRQQCSQHDPCSNSSLAAYSYHPYTDSISSSKSTTLSAQVHNATAATATTNDDIVMLCEETVDAYTSESCSSFCYSCCSHYSSTDMDMVNDLENRDQQTQQGFDSHTSARKATAVAAVQESSVLQMLNRVASHRKGYAALNSASSRLAGPHAAAAPVTGSQSVNTRLLITEVSVYCYDMEHRTCWDNSPLALAQANHLMEAMTLPGSVAYMPITSDSWIFQAAARFQFPSFTVCLGSSYLQRMMATLPQLAEAASAVPEFECYCNFMPAEAQPPKCSQPLTGRQLAHTKATLRSLQFTCLFLALKAADRVHALGLLRYILTQVSCNQERVTLHAAADIEAQCLCALDWRLGPWFGETELSGSDEELWAAAMGGLDYGTDRDCWH